MTSHHRRTSTDRPEPPDDVAKVAGRRRGDDDYRGDDDVERDPVAERDLPAAGSVRVWRPRPATPEELDDARTVLVVHRLDPRAGRCAACAADCPCPPALEAGRVLAEAGAWNTVPFAGPGGWRMGLGRTSAAGGWVTRLVRLVRLAGLVRLVRCLPWTAAK